MYEKQSKNTLILDILQILEKYSDVNHRLTQNDIISLLKSEFDMDVERKSIVRNINNLIEAGYDISYDEKSKGKGKNKIEVKTNFYIERDFDDSELMFLTDGIIFSKLLSSRQKKQLIRKLEGLSSKYFKSSLSKVCMSENDKTKNEDLFLNIEIIAEAISKGKKIKFNYLTYDITKKLVYRRNEQNEIKQYVVSPYQMVASNGRYYLLCSYNKYEDEISNLRVDRIINAEILDEKIDKNKAFINFNIPKHMIEHIYMMSGDSENVTFEFNKKTLINVIDWFGNDIIINKGKDEDKFVATAKVNVNAMRFWALQYGDNVTIKSPKSLVDRIKEQLNNMSKRYKWYLIIIARRKTGYFYAINLSHPLWYNLDKNKVSSEIESVIEI